MAHEKRRVTQTLEGRKFHMPDYPLLPGDIILGPDEKGEWTKHAPGLCIGGFVLSEADLTESTEPAPEARWVLM